MQLTKSTALGRGKCWAYELVLPSPNLTMPLKRGHPKRKIDQKIVFQPSIFRYYIILFQGRVINFDTNHPISSRHASHLSHLMYHIHPLAMKPNFPHVPFQKTHQEWMHPAIFCKVIAELEAMFSSSSLVITTCRNHDGCILCVCVLSTFSTFINNYSRC